ncbi:MAG: chaperone modulator CbpM [Alphaproteobacteria bacterium]
MIDEKEVLETVVGVRRDTLRLWVERGWVAAEEVGDSYRFRDIDVARIELISEFRSTFALSENALDVVLPLLDQVHGLRHQVRRMAEAINDQPEDVRQRIADRLADRTD